MRVRAIPLLLLLAGAAGAQPIRSLKGLRPPEPPGLNQYVRNSTALVALGKAFFWDMQAGSDGRVACATCHFHAGADHRPRNQTVDPNGPFAINRSLTSISFPLRMLSNPLNRNSEVLWDTGMRIGSAGLFRRTFRDIVPGSAAELGIDTLDQREFMVGDIQVRRVTVRNTPSVINAGFYVRGFWDGRASRFFNGFTPSGNSSDAPGVLELRDGILVRHAIQLDNSSLASQATGPALDHLEMSYAGRTWPKLGKKMLSLRPLALQRVARTDSVLGDMAHSEDRGLEERHTYLAMIQNAFEPKFWESTQLVTESGEAIAGRFGAPANTNEFTQAEYNFSLFWSLALQAYQATLISDDSPFDRFMSGDEAAMTAQEQEGMQIFQTTGRCTNCHTGAEFSAATFNGGRRSFQRTGVRPAAEDPGSGNGSFKSIGLRNLELTGPYFHNGGQATIEQVIEFYMRSGDFSPTDNIRPFNLSSAQRAALAAFLRALTDERVRHERAPFDHPELCVATGHLEDAAGTLVAGSDPFPRSAAERWASIPAVGAGGSDAPLRTFDEMLRGIGNDGSRAHTLNEPCTAPLP